MEGYTTEIHNTRPDHINLFSLYNKYTPQISSTADNTHEKICPSHARLYTRSFLSRRSLHRRAHVRHHRGRSILPTVPILRPPRSHAARVDDELDPVSMPRRRVFRMLLARWV